MRRWEEMTGLQATLSGTDQEFKAVEKDRLKPLNVALRTFVGIDPPYRLGGKAEASLPVKGK